MGEQVIFQLECPECGRAEFSIESGCIHCGHHEDDIKLLQDNSIDEKLQDAFNDLDYD